MHNHLGSLAAVLLLTLTASGPAAAQSQAAATPASSATSAPATASASAALTPDAAKTLLGDWTISAEGPMGPATMVLTLKLSDGQVAGEMASDQGKYAIADITKRNATVTLRYTIDYQGMPVSTVVTLDPGTDADTLSVSFDFADGAYQMGGTAARKKAL